MTIVVNSPWVPLAFGTSSRSLPKTRSLELDEIWRGFGVTPLLLLLLVLVLAFDDDEAEEESFVEEDNLEDKGK